MRKVVMIVGWLLALSGCSNQPPLSPYAGSEIEGYWKGATSPLKRD